MTLFRRFGQIRCDFYGLMGTFASPVVKSGHLTLGEMIYKPLAERRTKTRASLQALMKSFVKKVAKLNQINGTITCVSLPSLMKTFAKSEPKQSHSALMRNFAIPEAKPNPSALDTSFVWPGFFAPFALPLAMLVIMAMNPGVALAQHESASDFVARTPVGSHDTPLNSPNALMLRYWQVTGDLPSPHSFILRPVNNGFYLGYPPDLDAGDRPVWYRFRARRQYNANRRDQLRILEQERRVYQNRLNLYESLNLQPKLGAVLHLRDDSHNSGNFTLPVYAQLHGITTTNTFNTHLPHGNNLEAIFPAKGLTTQWSLKASFGIGPLHVRLDPTILYAESRRFDELPLDYPDFIWRFYFEHVFNVIDRPFRYRTDPYLRVMPGNSEVALRFGAVSLAASTSNIWWGPGQRNALLLTNNAEGFLHATIRSDRPLQTRIGGFEFQAFWGKLEASGVDHLPVRRFMNTLPMSYIERSDDWRLLSGLALTWQPSFAPGFTIGAGRTIMAYSEDVKTYEQALFSFLRSPYEVYEGLPEDRLEPNYDQRFDDKFALYVRYKAPSDQFEVYGEWGRNARPESWSDFMQFPEHGMGWILGMNKFFPLRRNQQYIRLGAEFTQLEKSNTYRIRHYPTWYTHRYIRHGYTHRGQVLGAGIGPGSNAQYLGIDYLRGTNRIGVYVERTIYNNDLYYILFGTTRLRHYADVNFGLEMAYSWRRLTFSGRLSAIKTFNYLYIETTEVAFQYSGYDPRNRFGLMRLEYKF